MQLSLMPTLLVTGALVALMIPSSLSAADHDHADYLPRIGPQILLGTSGIEPGLFAEWRLSEAELQVRPEILVNEDGKVGGGGAIMWEPGFIPMPERNALAVGPRVVFHDSDDSGWEVDVMAIWSLDLIPTQPRRHFLEVIGALGVLEDRRDNSETNTRFGASIGVGYGFQF